jgi:hypothetical protein
MNRFFRFGFVLLVCVLAGGAPVQAALSEKELESIGRRVWQNECNGRRDGLTSWNAGENFASLGIGHFIWYPRGVDGPFEESFPKLLQFLTRHRAAIPAWLRAEIDCPWSTREEFQRDFHSDKMNELRDLLANTVPLQSRFLADRMEAALPKMLEDAPAAQREIVRENFQKLSATGNGTFALIDYVNFKGEGTNPRERYKGEGWGLLQVLGNMKADDNPVHAFAESAAAVLERRVRNSPPERNEARWLPGWKTRVRRYAE